MCYRWLVIDEDAKASRAAPVGHSKNKTPPFDGVVHFSNCCCVDVDRRREKIQVGQGLLGLTSFCKRDIFGAWTLLALAFVEGYALAFLEFVEAHAFAT